MHTKHCWSKADDGYCRCLEAEPEWVSADVAGKPWAKEPIYDAKVVRSDPQPANDTELLQPNELVSELRRTGLLKVSDVDAQTLVKHLDTLIANQTAKAVREELQSLINNHAMVKTGKRTYENDDAQLGAAVRKRFLELTRLAELGGNDE